MFENSNSTQMSIIPFPLFLLTKPKPYILTPPISLLTTKSFSTILYAQILHKKELFTELFLPLSHSKKTVLTFFVLDILGSLIEWVCKIFD